MNENDFYRIWLRSTNHGSFVWIQSKNGILSNQFVWKVADSMSLNWLKMKHYNQVKSKKPYKWHHWTTISMTLQNFFYLRPHKFRIHSHLVSHSPTFLRIWRLKWNFVEHHSGLSNRWSILRDKSIVLEFQHLNHAVFHFAIDPQMKIH